MSLRDKATLMSAFGTAVTIAGGAAGLLVPAMLNGFPFVFEDSADYLVFTPRIYRSPYYGLFIFFFHLNTFIWLAVLAQAIILSHLIWLWVRVLVPARQTLVFLVCLCLLTLLSSLPFMAGFLMADVFTAVMILAMGILAFHGHRLSSVEKVYVFLLLCVSIVAHVSHLAISVALLASILVVYAIERRSFPSLRLQLALIATPILLSASAISLNNGVIHGTFAVSPAGPSFALANLIEHGPARRYLQEACPKAGFKICDKLDEMPNNIFELLWATDFYEKLGGFKGMRGEASQIVNNTVRTRPLEVAELGLGLVAGALVTRAPGAELRPVGNGFWLEGTLEKRFGLATLNAYLASAQRNDQVPRSVLRAIDLVVFPLAFFFVIGAGILSAWHRQREPFQLCAVVLSGFAANTVLCALASGVFDRYQARVTWLFPFAMLLITARLVIASRSEPVVYGRFVLSPTNPKSLHAPHERYWRAPARFEQAAKGKL